MRNFFAELSRSRLTAKRRGAFAPRLTLGRMSRNWLWRIAALGRRSKREIMNCSAKDLNGTDLRNRWTVEIIYRDGSLPTTFTIEERAEMLIALRIFGAEIWCGKERH
jgi:hypothetical protein